MTLQRIRVGALALLFAMPLAAGAGAEFDTISGLDATASARWSASGGRTSLRFDAGLMDNLQWKVTGSEAAPTGDLPGDHLIEIETTSELELWAPRGAFDGFTGGNILWSAGNSATGGGCTDVYGVSTNDTPSQLGIRSELPAFTGAWEQCGSMFAPGAPLPGPCAGTVSGHYSLAVKVTGLGG